jgi:stage II sporulation protein D
VRVLVFACCFVFVCSLVAGSSCFALPTQVKVALFDSRTPPPRLTIWGPCLVASDRSFTVPVGRYLLEADSSGEVCLRSARPQAQLLVRGRSLRLRAASNGSLRIEEPRVSSGALHSFRRYKGSVIVSTSPTGLKSHFILKFVNAVSRREYLASVVASEMPRGAHLEALKAQSVLVNTQLDRFSPSQIIEDSTQVQSYGGVPDCRPETYEAVGQTFNQTLEFDHKPIQAFFHSTCSGMTSKPIDIFGGHESLPYLTNVKCNFCSKSPFWGETIARIPASKFETIFGIKLPEIVSTDIAGRPTEITYQIAEKTVTSNGYQCWLKLGQSLGWDKAPGTKFSFSQHDREVFIKSRGAGHGVGLCQHGAIGMAREGKTYKEILAFYFPGTTLSAGQAAPHQALSAR